MRLLLLLLPPDSELCLRGGLLLSMDLLLLSGVLAASKFLIVLRLRQTWASLRRSGTGHDKIQGQRQRGVPARVNSRHDPARTDDHLPRRCRAGSYATWSFVSATQCQHRIPSRASKAKAHH